MTRSGRLRVAEIQTAAAANAVIPHSNFEASLLRRALPEATMQCIGWSPRAARRSVPFHKRNGIVFVASDDHAPNLDAAAWLVDELMPTVWRLNPALECILVESAMPAQLKRLAGPRLIMAGQVPDLSYIFGRARLTVAPLRSGAGLKSKVLDGYAAGLSCALTPIAAEGTPLSLPLRDGIGHDAPELAAIIVRLHDDAGLNRLTAAASRRLLARQYGQNAVVSAFKELLTQHASPPLQHGGGNQRVQVEEKPAMTGRLP